jgi:hypothetical protein
MLDIADALPLILERSGRRTELQIPTMLALLFTRMGLCRDGGDGDDGDDGGDGDGGQA